MARVWCRIHVVSIVAMESAVFGMNGADDGCR